MHADWHERAALIVRDELRGQHVTGEDIRLLCEARGVCPAHYNAWGAFIAGLVRHQWIAPTAEQRPMRANKSHARRTRVYAVPV